MHKIDKYKMKLLNIITIGLSLLWVNAIMGINVYTEIAREIVINETHE